MTGSPSVRPAALESSVRSVDAEANRFDSGAGYGWRALHRRCYSSLIIDENYDSIDDSIGSVVFIMLPCCFIVGSLLFDFPSPTWSVVGNELAWEPLKARTATQGSDATGDSKSVLFEQWSNHILKPYIDGIWTKCIYLEPTAYIEVYI